MISKKTYVVAASVVGTIVAAVIVVFLLEMLLTPGTSPAKKSRRSDGGQLERVHVAEAARSGAIAVDTSGKRLPA